MEVKFQEAEQCGPCKARFGLFLRRHHCRVCGISACEKCSSRSAPAPSMGLTSPVRVCDACYTKLTQPAAKKPAQPKVPEAPKTQQKTPAPKAPEPVYVAPAPQAVSSVPSYCTCDMPLCICEKPATETPIKKKEEVPEVKAQPKQPVQATPPPSSFSSFSGFGQQSARTYNLRADRNELNTQCRDAVKAKDSQGVRQLLEAKADPNFGRVVNGQADIGGGTTLLHLVRRAISSLGTSQS